MPGTKLTVEGTGALKQDAYVKMMKEQKNTGSQIIRGLRYEWEYREGKKTAVKAGVGLSVGMLIVIIGAPTHGVGVPLVIGLAVAGLTLSKVNDAAFAKFWGRDKTGRKRTRDWMETYEAPETTRGTKDLEERAHKILKRAFQHYLSAWEKAQKVMPAWEEAQKRPTSFTTCDEAHKQLKEMLHILRHLEKAWLYIQPAIYLSQALLDFCEGFHNGCDSELLKLTYKEWHDVNGCGSQHCYLTNAKVVHGSMDQVLPLLLWQQDKYDEMAKSLREAKTIIERCMDQGDGGPTDPFAFRNPWSARIHGVELYDHAARMYNQRSIRIKMWHGVTNDWHRKTKAQQRAFLLKHFGSLAVEAGTLGMVNGAGEVLNGFGSLVEITANFAEEAIAEFPEEFGIDGDVDVDNKHIDKKDVRVAAVMQESLRNSAIHLFETFRISGAIEGNIDPTIMEGKDLVYKYKTCDEAAKYYQKVYQVQYHLSKAQEYLGPTIIKVAKLAQRIGDDCAVLRDYNGWIRQKTVAFLDSNKHQECSRELCIKSIRH